MIFKIFWVSNIYIHLSNRYQGSPEFGNQQMPFSPNDVNQMNPPVDLDFPDGTDLSGILNDAGSEQQNNPSLDSFARYFPVGNNYVNPNSL